MGKFFKEYQVLFGLVIGIVFGALIFSGTAYFMGTKKHFTPPAYANPGFPTSKAVVAAFPYGGTYPGVVCVHADGTITRTPVSSTSAEGQCINYHFASLRETGIAAFQSGRSICLYPRKCISIFTKQSFCHTI